MAGKFGSSIEWYGLEQLLSGYDLFTQNMNEVYYSIWQAAALKYSYTNGNVDTGREMLQQQLAPVQANGGTAIYTICFHPALDKDGNITNKTEIIGSCNFRMNDAANYFAGNNKPQPVAAPAMHPQMSQIMDALKAVTEQQSAIIQRQQMLEDLMHEEPEEDEEEEEEENDMLGKVRAVETTIQQSPLLNDIYQHGRLALRILAKKMGLDPSPLQPQHNTMAGTESATEQAADMRTVMTELVQTWPELPGILQKLHHIMHTDRDTFDFVIKKVNNQISQL